MCKYSLLKNSAACDRGRHTSSASLWEREEGGAVGKTVTWLLLSVCSLSVYKPNPPRGERSHSSPRAASPIGRSTSCWELTSYFLFAGSDSARLLFSSRSFKANRLTQANAVFDNRRLQLNGIYCETWSHAEASPRSLQHRFNEPVSPLHRWQKGQLLYFFVPCRFGFSSVVTPSDRLQCVLFFLHHMEAV